jgi:hypothetical protein
MEKIDIDRTGSWLRLNVSKEEFVFRTIKIMGDKCVQIMDTATRIARRHVSFSGAILPMIDGAINRCWT